MEKPQHAARIEQVVTAADIDSLLVAGEFERAKEWSRARIVYLEKVIQELPTASSQLETTDIASWQTTRTLCLRNCISGAIRQGTLTHSLPKSNYLSAGLVIESAE